MEGNISAAISITFSLSLVDSFLQHTPSTLFRGLRHFEGLSVKLEWELAISPSCCRFEARCISSLEQEALHSLNPTLEAQPSFINLDMDMESLSAVMRCKKSSQEDAAAGRSHASNKL